jgi:eukaryotic-like serine/threonine-protein kinase
MTGQTLIGQTLSHYHIIEKLGAGGMGEVYLAEDKRLNRRVAIKILPADVAGDERAKQRLLREAQTAATLDHPNICAIYEIGQEEGRSFIVLQYIEGETLAARLMHRQPDLREALAMAAQVADALAEAQARGIVHRDIKPQNIMLTKRGQVKVLDFGLAKVLREPGILESDAQTC